MHDLTGFQRDLLYVIAGREDPHGLAIKEELESYYEKWGPLEIVGGIGLSAICLALLLGAF